MVLGLLFCVLLLQGCIVSPETQVKNMIDAFETEYQVTDSHVIINTFMFSPEARIVSVSDKYLYENRFVRRHAAGSGDVSLSVTLDFSYRHVSEMRTYDVTIKAIEEPVLTETKTINFTNLATEYTVISNSLPVFIYNQGVPYVEVEAFIRMLEGAIDTSTFVFESEGDLLQITYGEEDAYTMQLDFSSNMVDVSSFDFFQSMSSETETEFGKGLRVVDYIEFASEGLTLPLGSYGIDLIKDQDAYLIPFHIANLFFSGSMYDVYYNYDALLGFDTYQVTSDPDIANQLRDSSSNSNDMPYDLRYFSYNFLAFSMDYFYGLKTFESVETYYDVLGDSFYMFHSSDKNFYLDVVKFAFGRDDLHTSYIMSGYYEYRYAPQITIDHIKPRTLNYLETYWSVQSYCDSLPQYEIDTASKTLILNINGFDADTIDNLLSWFEQVDINNIDNIVYNLTCNGGGVIGSMLRTIGLMTTDAIPLHSVIPIDDYRLTQYIQAEEVALDKNIYLWISPLTFSAANLMTSMVKEMGFASIVGQTTSGGACAIQTLITPDGTILLISSQNGLANQDYSLIENGIEPDVWMQNPFSKSELLSIINQQT